MLPTQTTDGSEERDDFPCFELKFKPSSRDFLKRHLRLQALEICVYRGRGLSAKKKWPKAGEETQINAEVVQ